jgi:hypothetical protein
VGVSCPGATRRLDCQQLHAACRAAGTVKIRLSCKCANLKGHRPGKAALWLLLVAWLTLLLLLPVPLTFHTMLVMEGAGLLTSRMMLGLRALAGFLRPNIVSNNQGC